MPAPLLRARLRPAALLAAVPACWLAAVQAQDAGALRPVTVTAQPGVAQDAFDTPASVDVIDGDVARRGGLQVNISETLQRVPGVVAQNRQNYAQDLQIAIRGYGARATFGVRGLRIYVDGIPATTPDGQGQVSHIDLASAARIEVLRGPFSALYGNASGGVLSVFTADGEAPGSVALDTAAGSHGTRRHTLQAEGAAGTARWRIAATGFHTDGYRDHSAADRRTLNARLRLDPGSGTRVGLVFNTVRLPDTQDPLGLTRAEWQADPRQAGAAARAFDTRKSVEQTQLGATLAHRLGPADRLELSAWTGQRDTLQFQAIPVATQAPASQPGGVIDLARRYGGLDARWVHSLRTAAGPATLTAGLTWDRNREQRRGWQNFIGQQLGAQGALRRDERNTATAQDAYLQSQWTLGARFSLSAGVRHSVVRLRTQDRYIVPGNGDDSGGARFAATTPAAGLVWHVRDGLNLYGSIGRGFETPTLNELAYRADGTAGLNTALRPATSRQWELGTKLAVAEAWQAQLAVFQARTRDEIVVLANTGGRASFQNAGSTRRDGVELGLQGRWGQGWSTQVAATWLQARYENGFSTCAAAPCAAPTVRVPAGNRLPGVPRTSLFAELAWQARGGALEAGVEWRHVGRIAVDDANSDFAPAADTLAVRATLQQRVGRWTFRETLRIDNLTDRRYAGSVIVNEGNRRFFEPAPGRHWLVGVSARYAF